MVKFDHWLGYLVNGLGMTSALAISAVTVLIALDIAVRYLKLGAMPWAVEIVEYIIYAATFVGAPWVLRKHGHVRMDAMLTKLNSHTRRFVDAVVSLIGIFVSAILMVYGYIAAHNAWQEHLFAYKSLTYPEWLLLLPIPVCGFVLCLQFLSRLFLCSDKEAVTTTGL
ncbi:MAG: C4-dicarboxylate ABC transporter permease [Rhizobiaceae bacterium MnEN-MB40S]|nr:MAG: C4-dicarboxylate ABC transporter permease [Rhizobiaceae bacterium MnEN-MB40S]